MEDLRGPDTRAYVAGRERRGHDRVPQGRSMRRNSGRERLGSFGIRSISLVLRLTETTIPRLWRLLDTPTPELVAECRYSCERQFLDETEPP